MPTVFPPPPILTQLMYYLELLWMNNFVQFYLFMRRRYRFGYYKYPPTFQLTVDQKKLPSYWSPATVDVFLPESYRDNHPNSIPKSAPKKYPLFIDIHGGGFNVGHPVLDAQFCRYITDKASCITIALTYRKTPYTRWPTQVYDLTALVVTLLEDPRLDEMVDKSRVVIGGFSAGGNFSTVLSIQPELKGRIQAIVLNYPILDFTTTTETKLKLRPAHAPEDALKRMGSFFSFGYVPLGTDRENPNLSPLFAKAEDLPENIYLVGCEYDMLNIDAKRFHEKFGKVKKNFVYEEVNETKHGFTHESFDRFDPKEHARLNVLTNALYDRIAEWLLKTVWQTETVAADVT